MCSFLSLWLVFLIPRLTPGILHFSIVGRCCHRSQHTTPHPETVFTRLVPSFAAILLSLTFSLAAIAADQPARRPNVLLIMVDDK